MKGYIYKIINVKNGHFYIGSTVEIDKRRDKHFKDLKNGRHHSLHLQRAYNIYGEDSFLFKIVREKEFENENDLRQLEERYIRYCWNSNILYNVSKQGGGGDLVSYHPLINEIREKQKVNTQKRWDYKTDEEKKEFSQKRRGRGNPNFGNKWTEEQKKNMSKKMKEYYKSHDSYLKGRTFDEIHGEEKAREIKNKLSASFSKRIGEKNSFYGRHHSEETKKKLSESRKGKIPTNSKKVEYNGVIYDSAGICARELNMSQMTVCYRCRKEIMGFRYFETEKED